MQIDIQSIHFDADKKLIQFIRQKIEKLQTFNHAIQSADIFLRIGPASDAANKLVELKLHLPGHVLFASQQSKSFEEATDLCAESVRRQLEKLKS
jgi:putative sigma-54 modulation protein